MVRAALMPYAIRHRESRWCVVKETDGSTVACHETRQKALDQLRALYSVEPELASLDWAEQRIIAAAAQRWQSRYGLGGLGSLEHPPRRANWDQWHIDHPYIPHPRQKKSEDSLEGDKIGEALAEHGSDLSAEQTGAAVKYAGSGFRAINKGLRNGNLDPATAETVRLLDSAMRPLPQDTVVMRGIGVSQKNMKQFENLKPGDQIQDPRYISTTADSKIAQRYGAAGVIMKIQAPEGTPAIWMPSVKGTTNANEKELLLGRNTALEFVSSERTQVTLGYGLGQKTYTPLQITVRVIAK